MRKREKVQYAWKAGRIGKDEGEVLKSDQRTGGKKASKVGHCLNVFSAASFLVQRDRLHLYHFPETTFLGLNTWTIFRSHFPYHLSQLCTRGWAVQVESILSTGNKGVHFL